MYADGAGPVRSHFCDKSGTGRDAGGKCGAVVFTAHKLELNPSMHELNARPAKVATTDSVRFHRTGLVGVDAMTAATARTFPRHSHDQYGIGLIDSGAQASVSDSKNVEAAAGDVILVNPGEIHDGRPLSRRARTWRMLYLDPALVLEWQADLAQAEDEGFVFFAPVVADPGLSASFNRAFAEAIASTRGADTAAFESAALEVMARLTERLGRRNPRSEGPVAQLRKAGDLIDSNPSAPLSLAHLSGVTGLSRYQLHRGFLRTFGLSPHAYVMQRRVAVARRMIRAGLPLADAAVAAGFCDQSHLNRVFARQFGLSPGKYAVPGSE